MNLGYQKIITTPHVMSDFYQNDSTIILKGLKSLSDEIKNQSIDIELLAAAEYYVDFDFEAKISKEEFLTFGDNYILIELSFAEPPPNLYDIIFKLQLEKYKVILAHPERYMYFGHDEYQDLVNRGVFLQINALSMIGYYSPIVRKKTEELINNDFVSFVGTDCHNIEHARLYKKCQKSRLWHNLISRNTLLNHTL
jgi:protein-tyrosine phosphatase